MGKCTVPNCPNKDKDIAVERIIHTMAGPVVTGMFCMNCALKILWGPHGDQEAKWLKGMDTSKNEP